MREKNKWEGWLKGRGGGGRGNWAMDIINFEKCFSVDEMEACAWDKFSFVSSFELNGVGFNVL